MLVNFSEFVRRLKSIKEPCHFVYTLRNDKAIDLTLVVNGETVPGIGILLEPEAAPGYELPDPDPFKDTNIAKAEGWGLFDVDGRWQLQKLDNSNSFSTDAHAILHVAGKARYGSPYHMAAIAAIGTLVGG